MTSEAVAGSGGRRWAEHWSRGPADLAHRFNRLQARALLPLLRKLGLCPRGEPVSLGSVENRVFSCEVGGGEQIIVKLYRPCRWSLPALHEEMVFLHDLEAEGVPVVRPRRLPGGEEVGKWKGMFFVLFEREPVTPRAPGPFSEAELRGLGHLAARVHAVARRRPAVHRMTIEARTMGLGNLRCLERGGMIPADLLPEYGTLVRAITACSEPLLAGLPTHRLHGDFGVHNLLWSERGIVVADFDDFMMGPAAFDLCRVYVGLTTAWGDPASNEAARDQATEVVVAGYRELLPLPDAEVRAIEALRALRMVWNDAWKQARLHDAHFCEVRSIIRERGFWLARLDFLRGQAAKLRG